MPLDGIRFDCHHFDQRVQRNITDIVVLVRQEFAQDIDTKHSQSRVCFNLKYGQDSLVENRVSDILG